MTCDARIRPLPDDTEIVCTETSAGHTEHRGEIRDAAYPGSSTVLVWFENDRRNFHGDWPGYCPGCTLPLGHHGNHNGAPE